MPIHPKVKAGGQAATLIAALIAALAICGVDVTQSTQDAIVAIAAAALPIVAAYLKRAG